jgi:hypothetical protein
MAIRPISFSFFGSDHFSKDVIGQTAYFGFDFGLAFLPSERIGLLGRATSEPRPGIHIAQKRGYCSQSRNPEILALSMPLASAA